MSPRSRWWIPERFRMDPLNGVNVRDVSIEELQLLFANEAFTCAEYTQYCIARIEKINDSLAAVIEINPDAVRIAMEMDEERRERRIRDMLHGIPVLVNDVRPPLGSTNMATHDSMETTAGSLALVGSKVPRDAHVVSLLRQAGAVIIGKANLSEWMGARSEIASAGYSARGGQTRNPYDLSSSPFGSSSGSAVAVAANMVPLSFGTETDGSIIGPASINGVVGIKPTIGLTSRRGVIPLSRHMDSVGLSARTLADAVHGLNVIAKHDPHDRPVDVSKPDREDNYGVFLASKEALRGAKFGIPRRRCRDLIPVAHRYMTNKLVSLLHIEGARIFDVDFDCANDRIAFDGKWNWKRGPPQRSEFTVVKVDAYNEIKAYLSELSDTDIRSVEDIIRFNNEHSEQEGAEPGDHPAFASGQDGLREISETQGFEGVNYLTALCHIRTQARQNGIDKALRCHTGSIVEELDALLLVDQLGAGQQLAAQAGYPIICIPLGVGTNGLPFGLSVQGDAWSEGKLIKWASAIEDLLSKQPIIRPEPLYKNDLAENIPIFDNHVA